MDNQTSKKRNTTLIVLCILSIMAIIATSFYDLMLMLINTMDSTELNALLSESEKSMTAFGYSADQMPDAKALIIKLAENSKYHLLFNTIEAIGCVMLLCNNKTGMHFYAASQIGIAVISYMTMGGASMSMIMGCILFAYLYWRASMQMEE